jgi:hypothetical protein
MHKTPKVNAWSEKHHGVHLHFTQTGAYWLNVEASWFSILTE